MNDTFEKTVVFPSHTQFRYLPNGVTPISEGRKKALQSEILGDCNRLLDRMLTEEERDSISGRGRFRVKASSDTTYHVATAEWTSDDECLHINATHISYSDEQLAHTRISLSRDFHLDDSSVMRVGYTQHNGHDKENGYSVALIRNGKMVAELTIPFDGRHVGNGAISQIDKRPVRRLVHHACEALHIDRSLLNSGLYNAEIVNMLGNVLFNGLPQ